MSSDKIDDALVRENWQANLIGVYTAAKCLALMPLDRMIEMAETSQAITPLLNPTLYMRNGKAAAEDLEMLRAAKTFADTLAAGVERSKGRKAG